MAKQEKNPVKENEVKEESAIVAETAKVYEEPVDSAITEKERWGREKARREEEKRENSLATWKPKTKLGRMVKNGEIKNIKEIFDKGYKILEAEIPDILLHPKTDLIAIGQSKGKFGGGKRRIWRQTQRKTAEGNVPTFACMAIAGDGEGHIGIGYGKSKETLPAREKATRNAKINITKIKRGCGSFDCSCNEPHSIPFKVKGKCGSVKIVLIPAPKGTGLVIEDECKKILAFAGIKDVYSKTLGQTRTKINLAKACFAALKKTKSIQK